MYFQALDNKKDCYGFFYEGQLHKNALPEGACRTWRYTPNLEPLGAEYAYLYTEGKALEEVCPESIKQDFLKISDKLKAFLKSFVISKISLDENCFYDLVPDKFLLQYFDLKNEITKHVFEQGEKPSNYDFLADLDRLLVEISQQNLKLDRSEFQKFYGAAGFKKVLKCYKDRRNKVEYNIFGTKTGRLSTVSTSFPLLTLKKDFRSVIKPHNDWFVELDYNAAEVRALLGLLGRQQPEGDIHDWNARNVYQGAHTREDAKKRFFAWLYNPDSTDHLSSRVYRREAVLDKYWDGCQVSNPFDRSILADRHHALNYLIQSTSSDLFLKSAIKVAKMLNERKSNIAFMLHDSVVIDFDMEDKPILKEIVDTFSNTPMGFWKTNVSVGESFGEMRSLPWKQ